MAKRRVNKHKLEVAATLPDFKPKPETMKDRMKYHAESAAETAIRSHPKLKGLSGKMLNALVKVGKSVHRETMKRI